MCSLMTRGLKSEVNFYLNGHYLDYEFCQHRRIHKTFSNLSKTIQTQVELYTTFKTHHALFLIYHSFNIEFKLKLRRWLLSLNTCFNVIEGSYSVVCELLVFRTTTSCMAKHGLCNAYTRLRYCTCAAVNNNIKVNN